MQFQQREQDAIDRWLALQCRVWWRKWWWLIGGCAVIIGWHVKLAVRYWSTWWWFMAHPPGAIGVPSFLTIAGEKDFLFWERFHYHFNEALILPGILIPLTLAGSLMFPAELVAAIGVKRLLQRKGQWIRKSIWLSLSILFVGPMMLVFASGIVELSLGFLCWCVIYLTIAEWIVFITTRHFKNWIVGINVLFIIALFLLFRLFIEFRMLQVWDTLMNINDIPIHWIALEPIAVAALISLVALIFLVRANSAPQSYMTDS